MGEVAEKTGSGGTPSSSDPRYYGGSIPFLGIGDITGRFVDTTQKTLTKEGLANSAAWVVPQGAISLAMYASYGKSAILSQPMATSQAFFNIVFSSDATRDFIYSRFQCAEVRHEWDAMVSTGTQPNLSSGKLKKWEVSLPQQPEQRLIGQFFKTLDSLIAAAERQEVLLRQKKQVYLQLMFPREGETQPRLRFAGFSGEWQQRQLGELGSAISGVGFPDAEQGGAGGLPFYKVSDMNLSGNELVMSASSNYVSAEQVMKNHWKPITTIPAIIFAKVGAAVFLDRKRVAATPFLMDNNMMAYIPNGKSWDVDFCLSVFNRIRLSNLARIGALPSINASDVEQHHIALPGLPEQHHIGSFFSTLDNLIAASEKRTASFRALKSAYLQRMFV